METLESDEFVTLIEGSDAAKSKDDKKTEPDSPEPATEEQSDWKPPKSLDLPPAPSPA